MSRRQETMNDAEVAAHAELDLGAFGDLQLCVDVMKQAEDLYRIARQLFGKALRKAREEAKVSRLDLANESGYTPAYIGSIEREECLANSKSAKAIYDALLKLAAKQPVGSEDERA